MNPKLRPLLLAAALLAAAGCSLVPQPRAVDVEYDFGPVPLSTAPTPRFREPVLVPDVTAPAWLDGYGIVYRLAYQDAATPRAYANSRWVTPPQALVTARLRARVARESTVGVVAPGDNVRADLALRVELLEFSQVFASKEAADVVVQMRATAIRGQRLAGQRTFEARRPAPTPDAAGAAAALTQATDALLDEVVAWAAALPK